MLTALLLLQAPPTPRILTMEIPGAVVVAGSEMRTVTTAHYLLTPEGAVRCAVRIDAAVGSGASWARGAPRAIDRGRFQLDDVVDVSLRVAGLSLRVVARVKGAVTLGDAGLARIAVEEERIVSAPFPMSLPARTAVTARYRLSDGAEGGRVCGEVQP